MLLKEGNRLYRGVNKKGQITIFIIIAIFIVAGVILFFTFRGSVIEEQIPASIDPIYRTFLDCLEEDLETGIDVLESQGGYIEIPDFEPGSRYMPFSSQLDFLGNPIPYWYYVSGNNLEREQVPSIDDMESQLEEFVEGRITACRFDDYFDQGFLIDFEESSVEAEANIEDREVSMILDMNLNVDKEEDSVSIDNHRVVVKSELGKLYESAREIYDYEQDTLFLEERGVDILTLYAPVDGVEISCSPKIWEANKVFDELQEAIEANTLALKNSGASDDYFALDIPIDSEYDIRFLNSRNWPNAFEVTPTEGSILIAEPVGNQAGLGIMGFCYVPYHFVYDVKYPVLVQIYSDLTGEIFQFPLAVVIQGNQPRKALDVSAVEADLPELCTYKNTVVEVRTYDTRRNPIEADISYECFGTKCDIGKTGITDPLVGEFPQCVNGFISASSEGFKQAKHLYSTTEEGKADIILDRLYEMEVKLNLDGRTYSGNNGMAIITLTLDSESASEINSKTIVYPEQKTIELTEGQYEVQVTVYKNSSLELESSTLEECVDVPQSGIGGVFGFTKEECFDIEIPEQTISNALSGGGKENYYVLESELESSNIIEINAESLPLPVTIEKLQENYILFEDKELEIMFI